MMRRRDFVRGLIVSTAAFTAGPLVGRGLAGIASPGREPVWSGADFEGAMGTAFAVHGPAGRQRLVLDRVAHTRRPRVEWASLRFRGAAADRLPEGTYGFDHPALGPMSLFIIPGTVEGGACFYRVILSRLA